MPFFVSYRSLASTSALLLTLSALSAVGQQPEPPKPDPSKPAPSKSEPPKAEPPKTEPPKPAPPKPGTPKPFKDVITAEAKSDPGVFTVHRIDDKIYFEIPAAALNKEMLWATELERVPVGFGTWGGTPIGDRVVRWTRRNNKIYLRNMDYSVRSEDKGAIQRAVEAASVDSIIQSFDVEAEGDKKSAVIDVTRLFTSDTAEFSVKSSVGGGGVDPSRSYVEKVKSFPTNVEVKSLLTFSIPPRVGVSSATVLVHYSLAMLPDKPMQGRLFDSRVGYFTEGFTDYGRAENRAVPREFITRYRLEKKDPKAALSEPVKPIVYYISREVPERWRIYMKKAIEDWQPAFEAAGFARAIIAKDAPTEAEDPNWDPEDARYSVIRWAPLPIANAQGPHIHDPRSGEIISAHVIMWHDVLKLAEQWYFVQCAPLDPQAQKLPLPVPVMGELIRVVVAHEVGHTLGLRHNHKASSSFSIANLRDKAFTEKWGDEASIMDYGRFNYVAQPGDGARLMPKLGPYDAFAIEWGYAKCQNDSNPDAEKPELDKIAARQVSNPMLRFGGEDLNSFSDPTVQTEDLGDDPVEATRLGLRNLSRVAAMLVSATTKYGEDYDVLNEMYGQLFNQRLTELMHVTKLVGGVVQTDYHSGHGAEIYKPVPRQKQAEAVKFLVENAFATPRDLLLPSILYRIESSGVSDRVLTTQRVVLANLMSEARVKRMLDSQTLNSGQNYTVAQLVADVQNGIWSELGTPLPAIDPYRRNLQRNYLQAMKPRVLGVTASQTDLKPLVLGALRDLAKAIDTALPKVKDAVTESHLRDCRTEISRILNPKNV